MVFSGLHTWGGYTSKWCNECASNGRWCRQSRVRASVVHDARVTRGKLADKIPKILYLTSVEADESTLALCGGDLHSPMNRRSMYCRRNWTKSDKIDEYV